MRLCALENCEARHYAKGYCCRHYRRLVTHGDARWEPPTPADKFLRHVVKQEDGCWRWTGAQNPGGYGAWGSPAVSSNLAHRASYELFVGPIPVGLVMDHLCCRPWCVAPAHLEPVTNRENVIRGRAAEINAARERARTECRKGHPYTPETVRLTRQGWRRCLVCERVRVDVGRSVGAALKAEQALAGAS